MLSIQNQLPPRSLCRTRRRVRPYRVRRVPQPIVINFGRAGCSDAGAGRAQAERCRADRRVSSHRCRYSTPSRRCNGFINCRRDVHRLQFLDDRWRRSGSRDRLSNHRRRCRDSDVYFCCRCAGDHGLGDGHRAPLGAAIDRNDRVVCASYQC